MHGLRFGSGPRRRVFSTSLGCHTWRAPGVTIYLENDGRLEHAQQMARGESPRTTKLYDRTKDETTLSAVEANPAVTIDPKLRWRGCPTRNTALSYYAAMPSILITIMKRRTVSKRLLTESSQRHVRHVLTTGRQSNG
jgi:hypothetical protein